MRAMPQCNVGSRICGLLSPHRNADNGSLRSRRQVVEDKSYKNQDDPLTGDVPQTVAG
jgi:hypothetical protein